VLELWRLVMGIEILLPTPLGEDGFPLPLLFPGLLSPPWLSAASNDRRGPCDMNSLLSNVQTTYGYLLGARSLASMILTINLPLGGPTGGCVGDGEWVALAAELLSLSSAPPPTAVAPFNGLPAEVVPRGVAGGVSFAPSNSEVTSVRFATITLSKSTLCCS